MGRYGWRPFFLVLGLASLLWLAPWTKWMPKARASSTPSTTGAPNLAEFLRLRSAWGSCVGLFSCNYVNYFLITWLPFYLVREPHFSMSTMARIGGLAYLLGACSSTFSGWLSDRWIMSGGTPTRVRKTFAGGGLIMAGAFLGLAAAATGPRTCLAMLVLGVISFGVTSSNIWAITNSGGTASCGTMDGFSELCRQPGGDCGSGTHRIRRRTNRPLLLGFRHLARRHHHGCSVLGLSGWTRRTGSLAQEGGGQSSSRMASLINLN